jgi:hypothetical protein
MKGDGKGEVQAVYCKGGIHEDVSFSSRLEHPGLRRCYAGAHWHTVSRNSAGLAKPGMGPMSEQVFEIQFYDFS